MSTAPLKNPVLAAMTELLRPLGFRKTGTLFSRAVNDVLHLISLQSSTSSTASSLRATLNIAVWVPALAEANQRPDVWSAHWQERIGMLMPEHSDRWWTVTTEQDAQSAGALVRLWQSGASPGLTQVQAQRYLHRLNESSRTG